MASYNLLNEGWIPVITEQGQREFLGIREVLRRAHELREVSDASPMVEYGLYRFLGLFLMDALRPEDSIALEDLLDAGRFDMAAIDDYIRLCQREGVSFDLFDKERPFLQSAYDEALDSKARRPVQALDYTVPSGNNHTHFDHRSSQEMAVSYGEAARLTLAGLLFCTAGAQDYPSGVNASPPYFTVIRGKNLFETLCYTLIPLELIDIAFDSPPVLWRLKAPVIPKEKVTETSWLLGMLFPTRRITLIPDEEQNCVRELYLSQGMNFTSKEAWTDPCVIYRCTEKGRIPLRPNKGKAIWRNLNELIDVPGRQAPLVLHVYEELHRERTVKIMLYGVETSNASYLQTMRHTLTIPLVVSEDPERIQMVRNLIAAAERVAASLKNALASSKAIPEQLVAEAAQQYYNGCEQQLWQAVFVELAADSADCQKIYVAWIDELLQNAKEAHRTAVQRLKVKAAALAKIAKDERLIYTEIKKLKEGLA